jgi:hypothetical protein
MSNDANERRPGKSGGKIGCCFFGYWEHPPFLAFGFAFAGAQWIIVAIVAIINRGQLSSQTHGKLQNS